MRYRNGWANRSCFNNIFIDIKINNTANNTSVIQIVGIDNYFSSFFLHFVMLIRSFRLKISTFGQFQANKLKINVNVFLNTCKESCPKTMPNVCLCAGAGERFLPRGGPIL